LTPILLLNTNNDLGDKNILPYPNYPITNNINQINNDLTKLNSRFSQMIITLYDSANNEYHVSFNEANNRKIVLYDSAWTAIWIMD
jgi:hypothetical protein